MERVVITGIGCICGNAGNFEQLKEACASTTTAVGMAFDFIRNGLCDCAIAGGADSLNRLSAYGFHVLKSLSHSVCNPYDESHDGMTIGECGAFFMLESLSGYFSAAPERIIRGNPWMRVYDECTAFICLSLIFLAEMNVCKCRHQKFA